MKARLLAASLTAVTITAAVAWLLSARIASTVRQPLTNDSMTATAFPVEIPELVYLRTVGGPSVHRIRLSVEDVAGLIQFDRIQLRVGTYDTNPSLKSALLIVGSTDCVFEAPRGETIRNNELLTLERSPRCTTIKAPPDGQLRLDLTFDVPGRAALWADEPSEASDPRLALVVTDRLAGERARRPILRGLLERRDSSTGASRAELLAYVWQIDASTQWIWLAVGAAGILAWLGVFLLSAERAGAPSIVAATRAGLGGFCAAASLGVLYAVLVPPFQAADEPSHLVWYADAVIRPGMKEEASRLGQIGHAGRIMFHLGERFNPADRAAPGKAWNLWNAGTRPNAESRGLAMERLWQALPPSTRSLPIGALVLVLRLANAAIFSLAAAFYLSVAALCGRTRRPELLAIPIFLVPTLPFFAMTVSNYGVLTSIYVVLAAALVADFRDSRANAVTGLLIGSAWAIAVLFSRSAVALLPFVGAWVAGRMFTGGHRSPGTMLGYWAGFSGSLAAGLWLVDRQYLDLMLHLARPHLPGAAIATLDAVLRHPWTVAVAGTAAGAGAEYLFCSVMRLPDSPRLASVARRAAAFGALVMVLMIAGSAVIRYPVLPLLDTFPSPPSPGEYVRAVVAATTTMWRLAHHDFLTSLSFWGAFGWLETALPPAFLSVLTAGTGAACAVLLWTLSRAGDTRAIVRVGFGAVGFVGSLTAYALSVILFTPADLHGRYLIGLYLGVIAIGWSGIATVAEGAWARHEARVRGAYCGTVALIHIGALAVILRRYF